MDLVIAVIITAVVTYFVVQDAKTLRDEEIDVFGSSDLSPGLWGTGVFLLLIIFLPAYILTRMSHNKKLMLARMDGAVSPSHATPAGYAPAPTSVSTLDEIAKAHELLEKGALTQEEFDALKRSAFGGSGDSSHMTRKSWPVQCPHCGETVVSTTGSCPSCGHGLTQRAVAVVDTPSEPTWDEPFDMEVINPQPRSEEV